jgi:hypothetical protein
MRKIAGGDLGVDVPLKKDDKTSLGLLGIVWVNLHDNQIRDAGIADGEG